MPNWSNELPLNVYGWKYTDEWAAGFFDAEGHVGLSRTIATLPSGNKTYTHTLQVHVAQKTRLPLDYLALEFGGKIFMADKNCFRWMPSVSGAEIFLRRISKHSLVKRKQIELVLEYRATIGKPGGYHPKSEETIAYREGIWNKLKDYNTNRDGEEIYPEWDYTKAWLAGFFDGEGSVSVCRRATNIRKRITKIRDGSPLAVSHYLTVNITQKTPCIPFFLKEKFGGYISKPSKHSSCFKWRVCAKVAEGFLGVIEQSVLVKRKQIELAFQLRAIAGANGRVVTSELIQQRDDLKREITLANKERVL
jgi:hypothetical protein